MNHPPAWPRRRKERPDASRTEFSRYLSCLVLFYSGTLFSTVAQNSDLYRTPPHAHPETRPTQHPPPPRLTVSRFDPSTQPAQGDGHDRCRQQALPARGVRAAAAVRHGRPARHVLPDAQGPGAHRRGQQAVQLRGQLTNTLARINTVLEAGVKTCGAFFCGRRGVSTLPAVRSGACGKANISRHRRRVV